MLSGFGTTESLMTATTGKINFQVGSNHDDLQTLGMNIYENDKSGTVKVGDTKELVGNYIFDPIATKQSDRFFTCKMR